MKVTKEESVLGIITKAWEDETFKKQLIASPVETIEKFTGKSFNVPDEKKIVIADQSQKDTIYINIPPKPNLEDIELTENQLETVAGGNIIEELVEGFGIIKKVITEYLT